MTYKTRKKDYIGFGFNPAEQNTHFFVDIPPGNTADGKVAIYERFQWDAALKQTISDADILKLEVPVLKWDRIERTVANEFNNRLKQAGLPLCKFATGGTVLEKRFGKELMMLLWAIESADALDIPTALGNWLGLQPEERWWLYTMTNASTGQINDAGRGWRVALKYALCGNPIE